MIWHHGHWCDVNIPRGTLFLVLCFSWIISLLFLLYFSLVPLPRFARSKKSHWYYQKMCRAPYSTPARQFYSLVLSNELWYPSSTCPWFDTLLFDPKKWHCWAIWLIYHATITPCVSLVTLFVPVHSTTFGWVGGRGGLFIPQQRNSLCREKGLRIWNARQIFYAGI